MARVVSSEALVFQTQIIQTTLTVNGTWKVPRDTIWPSHTLPLTCRAPPIVTMTMWRYVNTMLQVWVLLTQKRVERLSEC